jgi:phosphoribosyl 1,2-cyclic phosphate phosphodiesterase
VIQVYKDTPIQLEDMEIIPIEAYHNRLQVFGYRFKDFVYLTDVKRVDAREMAKMKGVKVLVVNALREEPHHSHFNLEEALAFAEEVGAEKTYLTHISHMLGFHGEVEKKLPKNVHLAYDNLKLKI